MTYAELYAVYLFNRENPDQTFEAWLITVINAQNEQLAEAIAANIKLAHHNANVELAAQMSNQQVIGLYADVDALNAEIVALNNQLRAIRLLVINKHYDRVLDMLCEPATPKPAG